MLQRSPTYFRTGRNAIEIADELRELQIDETWIHEIVRRKILHDQAVFTRRSFTEPEGSRRSCWPACAPISGPTTTIETHFTPRLPAVAAAHRLHSRRRSVRRRSPRARRRSSPTRSRRFTETGILLKSGKMLEADIIVTATGFNLNVLGDIDFTIDGKPLVFSDTVTYRGMMFTGVPNMAWVFGYFRASWTLRADLVADFVCRLLNHMKETGARRVTSGCGRKTRTCRCCRGSIPRTSIPATSCAACICCRSAATSRNGSTRRTTGPRRTQFPAIDLTGPEFAYG